MAPIVILSPITDHGAALIDKLERITGERPVAIDHGTEDRTYYVGRGGGDSFESMLEDLDSNWREHIARSRTDT